MECKGTLEETLRLLVTCNHTAYTFWSFLRHSLMYRVRYINTRSAEPWKTRRTCAYTKHHIPHSHTHLQKHSRVMLAMKDTHRGAHKNIYLATILQEAKITF